MTPQRKILTLEEAQSLVQSAQSQGLSVVLCHGCFDIVHPGHVRHLQQAARLGDRLLVTVTGDTLIAKGTGRPLIPQELRAENLAALNCVSWVAVNPSPNAADLLERIRPNVYVKGAEYQHNNDPRFLLEKQIVERNGGRVVFTSGDVVFSSTALIAALEDSANPFHSQLSRLLADLEVTPESIDTLIDSFAGQRILVVGETIKDTYVMCDRPAVAGESPIMTLRPVEYRSFDGGAAIIARHLAALGARPILLTGLNTTPDADAFTQRLTIQGVEVHSVETVNPLFEKQRFLVGSSKVMKLDLGQPQNLAAATQQRLVMLARRLAQNSHATIIADFGLGFFNSATLTALCEALRPVTPILTGDVSGRRANLLAMRRMDLLCPSESEIRDALHDYDEGLSAVAWRLLSHTQSSAALATLGEDGLIAFSRTADSNLNPSDWRSRLNALHVPAFSTFAVDQLGCGDALLAAATLTLSVNKPLALAALLGSLAASCEAQHLGNAVISAADLRRAARRLCSTQLTLRSESLALTQPA